MPKAAHPAGEEAEPTPSTILLLGNMRSSLVVARSLGRKGCRIVVGSDRPTEVERSRYVSAVWHHPSEQSEPEQFRNDLEAYLDEHPETTQVIPVSQNALLALLPLAELIGPALVSVDPQLVLTCLNKALMASLADDLKVPQAPIRLAATLKALHSQAEAVDYPCVARPNDPPRVNEKAFIFLSRSHLEEQFPTWPDWLNSMVVQSFAPGVRYNRYFVAKGGRILRYMDVKTLRTDRLNGTGYGVEGVSVPPLALLDRPTERLLARLDYSGIGCAQFLVDEPRSSFSFLEINPRLGGNYAFTHACGLDQLSALIDHRTGRTMAPWAEPFSYRAGRRYAWSSGDLLGLMEAAQRNQVGVRGGLAWLARIGLAASRADIHLTFDRNDLKPSLHTLQELGRELGATCPQLAVTSWQSWHRSRRQAAANGHTH